MTLPDFEAWAIFASVVEHDSFTGAARALGMSKATISKAVTRLENDIGAPLFHRSSRRLTLTETGKELVDHARRIVVEGEAAMDAAREEAGELSGMIRLAAPMSFGIGQVAPILGEFLCAHRGVNIDLQLSDAQTDLIGEGYDLALRIAEMPDSSLRARKLRDVTLHTVASPAYLSQYGEPTHPAQLGEHRCLSYSFSRKAEIWDYGHADGSKISVRAEGPLQINNGEAMLPTICDGVGIARLPDFIADREISAGRIKPILADWSPGRLALHLVTPPSRLRTRRVAALIDYLAEKLSAK